VFIGVSVYISVLYFQKKMTAGPSKVKRSPISISVRVIPLSWCHSMRTLATLASLNQAPAVSRSSMHGTTVRGCLPGTIRNTSFSLVSICLSEIHVAIVVRTTRFFFA
jgi:hypothetical protein